MGVVAILVMWPECGEQTFAPSNHWGSMGNLALNDPVVSEEKTFEAFSLYESMKNKWPLGRAPGLQY